jgi:hypothetical protein
MKIQEDAIRLFEKIVTGFMSFLGIVIFVNVLLMFGAQIINHLLK